MAELITTKDGRGRAVCTIFLVSILIIGLSAVAGWYLFFRGGNDGDEREAYEQIIRYRQKGDYSMMAQAINEYFDTYNPDAFHYSMLKDLSDRFFAEHADWQAVENAATADAIRNYLDIHPDGFYRQLADVKLDSLFFIEAAELGTKEAVERYLEQYPQGKYVAKAQEVLAQLEKGKLTDEEMQMAMSMVERHFVAMGNNDRGALASTMASEICSYIGKADPELEDIFAYMAHVHSSGRVLVFRVMNSQVAKVELAGRYVFNVKFILEEAEYSAQMIAAHEDEEDAEIDPLDVKEYSGTAVLNENMQITSLVLKQ